MKKLLTLFTMLLLCIASTWAEDYSQGYYTMSPGGGASYFGYYSSANESNAGASVYGGSSAPKNAVIFTFEKTDQSDVYYWYDCNNKKYVYANSSGYLKTSATKVTDDNNYKWYIKDDGNGNLTITDMTGYNSGNPEKGLVQLTTVNGWWASKCTLSRNTGRNTWKLNLLFKKDTPYYIGLQRSSDRYLQYGSGKMQQAQVSEKTNNNIFCFTDAGNGAINIYSFQDNTPMGYASNAEAGADKISTANAVKNFYVRRTNNDSYPFAFLTEAGNNTLYLSNHGGTDNSNMGLYSGIDDSGTRLRVEEAPLETETLFASLLTTARQLVAPGRSHAGHPGFPALDVFDALQEAITVAEAVDTPTIRDLIALNAKINKFTSSTILLTVNKLYRFESACTSKPGYVISANASNGLIWGALDVTDGKQVWQTTWLRDGNFGTIRNVGTNLYPQGKAHEGGQLQLVGGATNTQIVALGTNTGQFNIKPNSQGAMHLNGWNSGSSTGNIVAWNSTGVGSASAWYIYEVGKYTVSITGGDGNGRIIVNGTEYANGQSFYNTKGSELTAVAKNIANHTTGDVVVDGNTISVTYTEATTVDLNVVYRYTDDNGNWVQIKSGTESVAAGATAQLPVILTADETLRFTGGTYQIGDGETTAFTMGSFAEAYTGNISFTAPDAGATLYVNLQVRPLPTTGKLYRFYNVSNRIHWMYNNGTNLAVTRARKSDRSDMFYLVETGTAGVYKFVSALNGNGYNQVTWQNQTNPVRYERTGRLTITRESSDLSVLIGQSGKTGNLQYLHANGGDDGHQVVVWSNGGGNSRWYVEEVPASEIANPALEIAKVEATRVLNKRGVGYPTASSAAYAALRTAVHAADATVETINAAVTAYSAATTEIQMPENGKTYTVTAVSKDDTKRYYMNYGEAGYSLLATTGLKDSNYPTTAYLTCKVVGDKYAFVNDAGKYFIFKGGDGSGADNSNKGYVDTYDAKHNFTVSRMAKGGQCTSENYAYLGYVSMMGYRNNSTSTDAYFVTTPGGAYDHAPAPFFNDNYSSALVLDEVSGHTPSTAASEAIEKIDVAIKQNEAIAAATPYFNGHHVGTGVGKYTVKLGETSYREMSDFGNAVMAWQTLSECVEPTITINQPQVGRTYAFKGAADSHQYMIDQSSTVTGKTNRLALTATPTGNSHVFTLLEGNKLQSYTSGKKYLVSTDESTKGYLNVGDEANAVSFEFVASESQIGAYQLKYTYSDYVRTVRSMQTGYVDGADFTQSAIGYQRIIEEVEPKTTSNITYQITEDGTVKWEETIEARIGEAYPEPTFSHPFVSALAGVPDGTVQDDKTIQLRYTTKYDIAPDVSNITKYYALDIYATEGNFPMYSDGQALRRETNNIHESKYAKGSADYIYAWAFVGNIFDGIKLYNKEDEKYVNQPADDSDTHVLMTDNPNAATAFTVYPNADVATAFSLKKSDFSNYLNQLGSYVGGGTSADAGSAIRAYEISGFTDATAELFDRMKNTAKFDLVDGAVVVYPDEYDAPSEINAAIDAANKLPESATRIQKRNFINTRQGQKLYNFLVQSDHYGDPVVVTYEQKRPYGTLIMPLNFACPEEWTRYYCSELTDDGRLVLTDFKTLGEEETKNRPFIIYSPKTIGTTYQFIGYSGGASDQDVTIGLLTGVLSDGGSIVPQGRYVLAYQKSTGVQSFRKTDGTVVCPQYKVYLTKSPLAGSRDNFYFPDVDDSATGLEELLEQSVLADGKYVRDGRVIIVKNGVKYNTNGQIIK